jgi:hypothetical protein
LVPVKKARKIVAARMILTRYQVNAVTPNPLPYLIYTPKVLHTKQRIKEGPTTAVGAALPDAMEKR